MASIPSDPRAIAEWIDAREAAQSGLKPDNAARVYLHDADAKRTPLSIVYLHGFTASPGECAHQPERLARHLGANAYVARLPGHGLEDEAALRGVQAADWLDAAEEAFAIGRRLGERVVLVGSSLGAGLASVLAARHPQEVAAVIAWSIGVAPSDRIALDQLCLAQEVVRDPRPRSDAQLRYWSAAVHPDGYRALRDFINTHLTHETAAGVHAPYYLAYYYRDEAHQDPTASVPAMRAWFDALGTPPAQRLQRAFADGAHAVGSPWRSDAAESVLEDTLAFLERVGLAR